MTTNDHLCLSGDLRCSGIRPCEACFEHVRREVLPKAIHLAGAPFDRDPDAVLRFLHVFGDAMQDSVQILEESSATVVPSEAETQPIAPSDVEEEAHQSEHYELDDSDPAGEPPMSEHERLEAFRELSFERAASMSPEQRQKVTELVQTGELEGWAELSEAEKHILMQIFPPSSQATEEAAEDEALSDETAVKVADALRRGELSDKVVQLNDVKKEEVEPLADAAAKGEEQAAAPVTTTD